MAIDPDIAAVLRESREDRKLMRQAIEVSSRAIDASNRVIAENQAEMLVSREESRASRKESRAFREESRAFREAHANDRLILRDLSAQIHASIEENRRHNDAVVGALTDLAAEIRGWGGSSRN